TSASSRNSWACPWTSSPPARTAPRPSSASIPSTERATGPQKKRRARWRAFFLWSWISVPEIPLHLEYDLVAVLHHRLTQAVGLADHAVVEHQVDVAGVLHDPAQLGVAAQARDQVVVLHLGGDIERRRERVGPG